MTTVVSLTQNPVQENTYLVYDNDMKEAIIFDPGCFTPAEEKELVATIDRLGLTPMKLINTHCHFDHIFGNAFVVNKYDLKLGIHPLEEQILTSAPMVVQMYGMPPMTPSPAPDYYINEGGDRGARRYEIWRCCFVRDTRRGVFAFTMRPRVT